MEFFIHALHILQQAGYGYKAQASSNEMLRTSMHVP